MTCRVGLGTGWGGLGVAWCNGMRFWTVRSPLPGVLQLRSYRLTLLHENSIESLAEEEPHEQWEGQVLLQQTPEEAEQQRLRDLPDPALARLVRGPLPSPPVPPLQSLCSSPWARRAPLSRAVSPEPCQSRIVQTNCFILFSAFVFHLPRSFHGLQIRPSLCFTTRCPTTSVPPILSSPVFCPRWSLTRLPTPPLSVSALVTTVTGFASFHHLDYATHLVSGSAHSPFSGGAPVFPLEVLEDRQFELGFLAADVPHLCALLLAPKGDPEALDIPIPRTHTEAVSGPWASYWIAPEEAEMASYRSTVVRD
ncbi:unnamed protein product [Closterium sp. NIES-53]